MERRRGPRPQRVLLVDDSDDIRELWRLWLTSWGFTVEEARDGYQALQAARRSAPALILMDLWMPVVDGVEAVRQLKADARTAHVPVVAISAQSLSPNAATVVAAGADAVLLKPSDPDVLIEYIRAAMGRRSAC
jgi:CheY-like chemotaxis protein